MQTSVETKAKPIIFSGPMVRAILGGKKTQTRRIVKPQPEPWAPNDAFLQWKNPEPLTLSHFKALCPYGKTGGRLWVRETFYADDEDRDVFYRADRRDEAFIGNKGWRPSMFMPRWASRLTLEITGIRVERLQDISEEDAQAEGVTEELIEELISPIAARLKQEPQHWIHGSDEGLSWCKKCALKETARLKVAQPDADIELDGGWDTEEDGPEFCEGCGVRLECTYTDYGCKQELDHFEEYGFNLEPDDCESMLRVLGASLWDGGELSSRIKKLSYRILWEQINGKGSWESNPWVWVVEFKTKAV